MTVRFIIICFTSNKNYAFHGSTGQSPNQQVQYSSLSCVCVSIMNNHCEQHHGMRNFVIIKILFVIELSNSFVNIFC